MQETVAKSNGVRSKETRQLGVKKAKGERQPKLVVSDEEESRRDE